MRFRRATDIIPPGQTRNVSENILGEILLLEKECFSGCVLASNGDMKLRIGLLLQNGRCCAIICGKADVQQLPNEYRIPLMTNLCQVAGTNALTWELTEEIVRPLSALFIGYPVERSDDYTTISYTDEIIKWTLQNPSYTGCLQYVLGFDRAPLLAFLFKGTFVGAFDVESQKYSSEIDFVYRVLDRNPNAEVEAWILPPDHPTSG